MVKFVKKLGVGLILGGLAGHYLSSPKGKALTKRVQAGLAAYQEDPEAYQTQFKAQAQTYLAGLSQAYENWDQAGLKGFFNQVREEVEAQADILDGEFTEHSAEEEDIIITYEDDED